MVSISILLPVHLQLPEAKGTTNPTGKPITARIPLDANFGKRYNAAWSRYGVLPAKWYW